MNKQKPRQSKPKPVTPRFDRCTVCQIRHSEESEACTEIANSTFQRTIDFWGEKHVASGIKGNTQHQGVYSVYVDYHKYVIKNFNPDHTYMVIELDD